MMLADRYGSVMVEATGDRLVVQKDGDEYQLDVYDFQNNEHTTLRAGALNINGFAMATSSLEIGEFNQRITVYKDGMDTRYADIEVEYED